MWAGWRRFRAERLGRWGERVAERALRRQGMQRLGRNYRCRGGEIDLVMLEPPGTVVFVEVKTRRREDFTAAEYLVAAGKRARLRRAARHFQRCHDLDGYALRFDVVVVLTRPGPLQPPEIRHYPGAFR